MGYPVVDGVVQYPPLTEESRTKILGLVRLFDTGNGVTVADLRRVAPLPRLELWNALHTLTNDGALNLKRRSTGNVEFEYFSVAGGE